MDDSTRKRIKDHLTEISARRAGHSPDSLQAPHIVEIQLILAEEQEKAAEKLEHHTLVLVRFTKTLVALTWALIFIGVIQIAMMIFKHP